MPQELTNAYYRKQTVYRELWLEHNPPRPWPCIYCDRPITKKDKWVVHHTNHDMTDNRVRNLRVMHAGCHSRHHNKGAKREPFTAEHRANLSKAMMGKGKGRKHSETAKRKMSAGQKARWDRMSPEKRAEFGKKISRARRS